MSRGLGDVYKRQSDDCLMEIFEMSRIYVGNECIEMKVPERICGGENEYVKWCNELCLNL